MLLEPNEDRPVARLCCQVAAQIPDILCNFYLVKNHKIANYSAITEAREKIDFDPLEIF